MPLDAERIKQDTSPGDILHLSKSKTARVSSTALAPWSVTFPQLVSALGSPRVGKKDGSYFVRGATLPDKPTRADAHIPRADLVILDGDSTVDIETGEIRSGAPDPLALHQALADRDIQHAIYTSHSHQQPGKGNRYRVLIPAPIANQKALSDCVGGLINELHRDGIPLADVPENRRWSQAWYFPRKASPDAEYILYDHDGGYKLDVGACAEWAEAQDPASPALLDAIPEPKPASGIHDRYNRDKGNPKWMHGTLEKMGYQPHGQQGTVNGEPVFRFLAPGSTSNKPGVALFKGKTGKWIVSSHHGGHDPLSASPSNDAFDLFRIFVHNGNAAAAKAALDPRPTITISGGSLARNVGEAVRAVAKVEPPRVFQRGSALCRVAHTPEALDIHGCTLPKGSATIVNLQRAGAMVELSRAAQWVRYSQKAEAYVDVNPCPQVTGALLESVGEWGDIRSLLGISECPILRKDGGLHTRPGFDPQTRLYVESGLPHITLPDSVSRADAQKAASELLAPFAEFPFVDKPQDLAVVLAYLFTLALRPQLPTAPLFCVSATTPGTGKGLLVEICNLIVRGRDAAIMPPVEGASGEDETRKRITALLLGGAVSVNLDNWRRAIGGESLNALLTAAEWSDRVLGASQTVRLPARVTWAATGNNLSVRGDMVRRSVIVQLDAEVERPEQRQFKVKNLVGAVQAQRGELLRSLFTILKGYQQAGKPGEIENLLGRFEHWSMAVAAPIRWLGFPDPVCTQERLRDSDPEADKLESLLLAWHAIAPGRWMSAADLVQEAEPGEFTHTVRGQRVDLAEALLDVCGERGRTNKKMLGWFLRHYQGRIAGGLRLERKPRHGAQKTAHRYRVVQEAAA